MVIKNKGGFVMSLPANKNRYNVKYYVNPSQDELRLMTFKYGYAVFKTAYGNLLKFTRNKARMAKYTYIIAPESDAPKYSHKVIAPEKAKDLIERQRKYIEKKGELIAIQGYLGLTDKVFPVQWSYTLEGANIAGMQQVLSFPREMVEPPEKLKEPFEPLFQVIYTPDFFPEEMPGKQAIIVDLENFITYVMGPDYFGESKKGALRMLNEYVYRLGGLVLHSGAKAIKLGDKFVAMAILGLSGTGKTTTTFSKQGELTQPIQDDMICLWPGGKFTITENGCFAKTYGLTAESEPTIYYGTINPNAWVENVFINPDGTFDFSKGRLSREEVARLREFLILTGAPKENVDAYINGKVNIDDVVDEYDIPQDGWDFLVWTQNGRSIIPMKAIKNAYDLYNIPPLKYMGILNRDEGPDAAMPGIVKFATPEQAAGYFMLGETSKTSAAGKERGKTRSPFTQPFFPRAHHLQAERFRDLVKTMNDVTMWLMNTGYIGGDQRDEERGEALKVKIPHSSAMLEAMITDQIVWKKDPDFGYYIVDVDHPKNAPLLQKVPKEILNPKIFFEKKGRLNQYNEWVQKIKKDREAFLRKYQVSEDIIRAVVAD